MVKYLLKDLGNKSLKRAHTRFFFSFFQYFRDVIPPSSHLDYSDEKSAAFLTFVSSTRHVSFFSLAYFKTFLLIIGVGQFLFDVPC